MDKMDKDLVNSKNVKGYFCFLANLKEFLNYYGFYCTENWLGGIIGFMGFYYSMKELPSKEVIHGRNGSFDELFNCLQERLDMHLISEVFSSENECLNKMKFILKTKNPVLVWVDQYYLNYSTYFETAHYWSLVNITGIYDDSVNLYDYETRCVSKDQFLKSIKDRGKVRIYYKNNKFIGYVGTEAEVVSAGLSRVVDMMQKRSDKDGYYGIQGMECFMDDLPLYNDKKKIYNICYQLNRASGTTATRRSMCSYLNELKSKWELLDTNSCLNLYAELEECWKMVGNLVFKLSSTMDKELGLRIKERIKKIISLERKGLGYLQELIRGLERLS